MAFISLPDVTLLFTNTTAAQSLPPCRRSYDQAVESFRRAIAILPEDPRAYFRMGNALFALERYPDARAAFSKALALSRLPGDAALVPKIHVNLGITLEAEGMLISACDHYRYTEAWCAFCIALTA